MDVGCRTSTDRRVVAIQAGSVPGTTLDLDIPPPFTYFGKPRTGSERAYVVNMEREAAV